MALTGPAEALSPAAFVYCRETSGAGNAFHARMFAGHLGIPEDPATGSAVASFAGAIMRFDRPVDGVSRHPIEQGVEMGRPSLIRLELDVRQGNLAGARIGGNAIKVSEGTLTV
jgi:trans-2,3-dihydro-3-hydroxyanthranilate isomerase